MKILFKKGIGCASSHKDCRWHCLYYFFFYSLPPLGYSFKSNVLLFLNALYLNTPSFTYATLTYFPSILKCRVMPIVTRDTSFQYYLFRWTSMCGFLFVFTRECIFFLQYCYILVFRAIKQNDYLYIVDEFCFLRSSVL